MSLLSRPPLFGPDRAGKVNRIMICVKRGREKCSKQDRGTRCADQPELYIVDGNRIDCRVTAPSGGMTSD